MGTRANIKVDPRTVQWGRKARFSVDTIADVTSSLEDQFFLFSSPSADYYCWYEVGGSGGTDPAVSGKTGVKVSIAADATAAAVATATAAAILALADFIAWVDASDNNKVLIECVAFGDVTAPIDGSATTGFAFAEVVEGDLIDLGFTDGDIELGLGPEEAVEVKAHQEGSEIVERISTGHPIESISLTLKESDAAKLNALLDIHGDNITPTVGGTKVYGQGTSKRFISQSSRSKRLLLHPVALSAATRTRDILFWLAFPQIEGRVFSGESEELVNVTFNILPDYAVDAKVRHYVVGEHAQLFDA